MNNEDWIELAIAACDHAGIDPELLEVVRTWEYGEITVYRLGDQRYLKLYQRNAQRQFSVECAALQTLKTGKIPAPRLIAAAAHADLPPYLVISAIPGSSSEDTWETLCRAEQLTVAREFGMVTAAYQQLPSHQLVAIEREVGGGRESIQFEREQLLVDIEAISTLPEARRTLLNRPLAQCDDLIHFINDEALDYFAVPFKFSHCALSRTHFFMANTTGAWHLSGIISWADAMLVPPEWDITYLWFWTFMRDQEAMKACLQGYFADVQPPDRFARRCFAAIRHTYSWIEIWTALRGEFTQSPPKSGPLVRQMTAFLFPPAVFGPPD